MISLSDRDTRHLGSWVQSCGYRTYPEVHSDINCATCCCNWLMFMQSFFPAYINCSVDSYDVYSSILIHVKCYEIIVLLIYCIFTYIYLATILVWIMEYLYEYDKIMMYSAIYSACIPMFILIFAVTFFWHRFRYSCSRYSDSNSEFWPIFWLLLCVYSACI